MKKSVFRLALLLIAALLAFGCGNNGDSKDRASESSSDRQLINKAREVVRDIVAGNFDEVVKRFDEGMKAALTADKLEHDWKEFVELKGEFRSQGDATLGRRGDEISVGDIQLNMAKESGLFRVSFDPEKKVSAIYMLAENIPVG